MPTMVRRITAPVQLSADLEGMQFTLESGDERFCFHIGKRDARAAAADTWRLLDEAERSGANVCAFGKPRRGRK